MGDIRLSAPRVKVIRAEGTEPVEFQTNNADLVLWDRTRAKHKWPKFDDAPFLWLTFLSWAAARRTGAIASDHTYERWESETVDVEALTDPDDDALPTLPGHEPG